MVHSPLMALHAALHAAYQSAASEEGDAKGEETLSAGVKGALSLQGLCEETGLSMDIVQGMMKRAEDGFMHRRVVAPGAEQAHRNLILYGLKEHRVGQPGWRPGIDF